MHAILNIFIEYVVPFIFVLSVLVFVHEFGHFLLAKLLGIRVERFSIGYPPRLFGKTIGDTDYCISATPFGGYVKLAGFIDESMDKEGLKGEPWEFMSKPIWARMLVIVAGPVFNVLLPALIFAVATFWTGIPEVNGPIVGVVSQNMPAQQAGLQKGDVITRIDNQDIKTWQQLVDIIHPSADKPLVVEWQRDGQILSATMTPQEDKIQQIGLIGIQPQTSLRKAGFFESIGVGASSTYNLTVMIIKSFRLFFTGEVSLRQGLGGPLRIAQMAGDSAKAGFGGLVIFIAFLSLNLAILNILPIPALDGGHLLFLTIEGIMRRPLSIKFRMVVQQIGMALLLALMIFVIFNDVVNFF